MLRQNNLQLTSSNTAAKKVIKTMKLTLLQRLGLHRIKDIKGNLLLCRKVRSTEGLCTIYVLLMLRLFVGPLLTDSAA